MSNPHPTFFATGNHETRSHLRTNVRLLRAQGMNWTSIGKLTGVSDRTAKRCHAEDEPMRKEARAAAYARAQRKDQAAAVAITGWPQASKIYTALVVVLLLIAAVAAFNR